MIVLVNSFMVTGSAEEFERAFTETAKFLCVQDGFISYRLMRSRRDPNHYMNVALWESEAALLTATGLPEFAEHGKRLRELAFSDPQLFESVVERHG